MEEFQLSFRDQRPDLETHIQHINENRYSLSLLLDGLSDLRNVGSLFRISDAARLNCIFGFQMEDVVFNKKLKRISRSTINYVPYQPINQIEQIEQLKGNHQLVALEITNSSIPYHDFQPTENCVLVVGSEQLGVSPEVLKLVDTSVHIPMHGVNLSMNVSVATGIVVFNFLEKLLKSRD